MRLFISINFDNETIKNILSVQKRLRKTGRGSFTHAENFHLTLIFLGEVPKEDLNKVKDAMDRVSMEETVLVFEGTGVFRSSSGYIYWLGIRKNRKLWRLHQELSDRLEEAGFTSEKRKFRPHITLARRFRYGDHITEEKKHRLMEEKFSFRAESFSLMKSESVKGRMKYTEIYKVQCRKSVDTDM